MSAQSQAIPEFETRAFVENASQALHSVSDGRKDIVEISLRTRFPGFALRIFVVRCKALQRLL